MLKCHVCNSTKFQLQYVKEIFQIAGKFQLVENIPASICEGCGEEIFSREATEQIREMLHGSAKPVRSVSIDVFTYQPKAS